MPETTEEMCDTCNETRDDCTCSVCDRCDQRYAPESASGCDEAHCDACCTPFVCHHGRRELIHCDNVSQCDSCERCADVCECMRCAECGDTLGEDDDRCEGECGDVHCRRCRDGSCSPESIGGLRLAQPHSYTPTFHKGATFKVNRSKRFISCELECVSLRDSSALSEALQTWSAHAVTDGSVTEGFEINTAPASGDAFTDQLAQICGALVDGGAKTDSRCGYHVHYDTKDLTWTGIARFMYVWLHVENAAFSLVSPSRRAQSLGNGRNNWCQRTGAKLQAAFGSVRSFDRLSAARSKELVLKAYDLAPARARKVSRRTKVGKGNGLPQRYYAVNLDALAQHGTIEFRLHHGATEFTKVTMWARLWATVLDYARDMGFKQIQQDLIGRTGFDLLVYIAARGGDDLAAWVRERTRKWTPESDFWTPGWHTTALAAADAAGLVDGRARNVKKAAPAPLPEAGSYYIGHLAAHPGLTPLAASYVTVHLAVDAEYTQLTRDSWRERTLALLDKINTIRRDPEYWGGRPIAGEMFLEAQRLGFNVARHLRADGTFALDAFGYGVAMAVAHTPGQIGAGVGGW